MSPTVAVLDYGCGNVRSAVRALERVGARTELTAARDRVLGADGLVVPGVGAFGACVTALQRVRGGELVGRRLAGSRPVLGICVGMQVLFDSSAEPGSQDIPGLAEWPGRVERLEAPVVPHMGWSPVEPADGTRLFAGVEGERFYFVHSYAVRRWALESPSESPMVAPLLTWAEHGDRFVAAVENGPLSATQFHPEKSGDAGATLLENWVRSL